MKLGAHVSSAGGLSLAVDRGQALAADALQIFLSSPRMWRLPRPDATETARFFERRAAAGSPDIFAHAIYLLNLCSADDTLCNRSIDALAATLAYATDLRLNGVVTHLGSRGGRPESEVENVLAGSLARVLERTPDSVPLLLESSAGGTVGSSFAQLGRVIRLLGRDARLGACVDTAHIFAAGYELRSDDGLAATLDEFDREIGLELLHLVHLNDSKVGLGAGVDRHENIGCGQIGEEAFRRVLLHPELHHLPFVLEVPGFEGLGPDGENMAILRRLAGEST